MGEALLWAEAKLGELIKQIPKESGKRTDLQPDSSAGTRLQKTGITPKQAHFAQTLADHRMRRMRFKTMKTKRRDSLEIML